MSPSTNRSQASAFQPEQLSEEDVIWLNQLAKPRDPLVLSYQDQTYNVEAVPAFVVKNLSRDWAQIDLEIEGRSASLYCSSGFIRNAVSRLDSAMAVDSLSPENTALLLEHGAAPFLDMWFSAGLPAVTFKKVFFHVQPPLSARLGLLANRDGHQHGALLEADTHDEKLFLKNSKSLPLDENHPLMQLQTNVSLRVGWTEITLEDLEAIGEGDGIILDSDELSRQKMMAVVAEHFAQSVEIRARELVLEGPLLFRPQDNTRKFFMADENNEQSSRNRPMESDIQGLPIRLIFELGRVDVPLSELENMNTGYVFDLARQPTRAVDILANGRKIGNGEVVRIGESLGIRVVNIEK
jgi:type III secretion protein Q